MANPDLLKQDLRQAIIGEIGSEENKARKRESQKRLDVYQDRIDRYIVEKLRGEFSEKTVDEMRKVLSINLCPRIINEEASIYNKSPGRVWMNASDNEAAHLDMIYRDAKVDTKMRQANRIFKLQDQSALYVVPRQGKIEFIPLHPHQFDVIPDHENPENAFAYVLSVFDLNLAKTYAEPQSYGQGSYISNDSINQKIADPSDRDQSLGTFIWWTKDLYFKTNGNGDLLTEPQTHIGALPFIDIAAEKDFEFFVRKGSSTVEFAIDFGVALSDMATINRLQGWSQAIIYATEKPQNLLIGPNHVLFLKLDPNRPEAKPEFRFESPSPDLQAGLELLEAQLRLFLTSKGLSTSVVTGKGDAKTYSSGIERLLAMIEKFEASRSDFDIFKNVESKALELVAGWNNLYQGVNDEYALGQKYQGQTISQDVNLEIVYAGPEAIKSEDETQSLIEKRLELGLMSRKEAIAQIRSVTLEEASEIIKDIDQELGAISGGGTEI